MFFFGINLALIMQSFLLLNAGQSMLTHWGPVMHLCVGKLTIIGSDNGLSPGWRQAFIWTIAGILSIGPLGTNFSEILIEIYIFSSKKNAFENVIISDEISSAIWNDIVSATKVYCPIM